MRVFLDCAVSPEELAKACNAFWASEFAFCPVAPAFECPFSVGIPGQGAHPCEDITAQDWRDFAEVEK